MSSISLTALRTVIANTSPANRLRLAADLLDSGTPSEVSQAEVLVLSVATELGARRQS